jgi:hypothetical protein
MNSARYKQPSVFAMAHKTSSQAVLPIIAFALLSHVGCEQKEQKPALATYAVTGQIIASGKLPVGGCVQFQPVDGGARYTANGIIDEQGRFSLQVPYVDRVLPGATQGVHTVRVLLPLNDGGTPVPIAGTFEVKPQDNKFTITMPMTGAR